MATTFIIFVGATFVLAVFALIALQKELRLRRSHTRINNFQTYASVLQFHLDKAYEIIYKDRILIYSLEATKFDEGEFKQTARDFGSLVLRLLGPTLVEELTLLYGNEETLLLNITEYFNTKFDDDEIRKTAQDSLMEQEIQ